MVVLEVHGVAAGYAAAAPVFTEATLSLVPGWYGLVGANGAGKSTLLRVLGGALTPAEGRVRLAPRDARVLSCPQEVEFLDDAVRAFAELEDALAAELRGRLRLEPGELARWTSLSPGERKRWQIGAALAADPDVLLLDEPTNHLDAQARGWLLDALARFRGIGVVVSHDRAVLEALPRAILRVHAGRVSLTPGAYSDAARAWAGERRALEVAHAEARDRAAALRARLADARREHASAERARSSRARMKDKHDHDARGALAKGRAAAAEKRAGRTAAVLRDAARRAEADVPRIERDRTLGDRVFAAFARAPQPVLFHLDAPVLRAGERDLLRDVRVTIGRDERVRVVGPNGAGKTTLLRALLEARRAIRDRVLYLPQELEADQVAALARDLALLDRADRGRVLSVFASLGSDPDRLLARRVDDAARLSPGEARKLALALGLGRHAWALVLDEPTNHLDLPTLERLEGALDAYPGCVVLVTHDDAFSSACTRRVLRVERGTVV